MSTTASTDGLIRIEPGSGELQARIVATQDCPPGTVVARILGEPVIGSISYATLQVSQHKHLNLTNELKYTNHSCDPNLIFDIKAMEARVVDGRPLNKGDELTFFYPSTEWDMAQPFVCKCGAGHQKCIGTVHGAKYLDRQILDRYSLSHHIIELLDGGER